MIKSKQVTTHNSIEIEARAYMEYLTSGLTCVEPEERERDSLSAPLMPAALCRPHPKDIIRCINSQFPKKWLKQINEIVW